jgi:hypothetical protein
MLIFLALTFRFVSGVPSIGVTMTAQHAASGTESSPPPPTYNGGSTIEPDGFSGDGGSTIEPEG